MKKLSKKDLQLLKLCGGQHKNITELFSCNSCAVLFR